MKIILDEDQGFRKEDGTFDQYKAFRNAGVKAAVCYKQPVNGVPVTTLDIRQNESDARLITRGINALFDDHTTPLEHQTVMLEITEIPKILCMVLHNEHQYTSDERSLRYTEVEPNNYITDKETKLYFKWLQIFEEIITKKYGDFYFKINNQNEKRTKSAIHKLAQENARYFVSVFQPTLLTHSLPWIQINKIAVYMEEAIESPANSLEKELIPYYKEFIDKLKKLKVLITKDDIYKLSNESEELKTSLEQALNKRGLDLESFKGDNSLLYRNNKHISLSLFADKNKFSGIDSPNEFGHNISYNALESFAAYAQDQRHRTDYMEMQLLDKFLYFTPKFLIKTGYEKEFGKDITSVGEYFPQGTLIKANHSAPLKNIIKYILTERSCEKAQYEIFNLYNNVILPDVYDNLEEPLQEEIKPYVRKLRCSFKDYNCPAPCGHPRKDRDL